MQMLHPDGHAPARPVEVPILVGALGPKGNAVARELGDGLYATLAGARLPPRVLVGALPDVGHGPRRVGRTRTPRTPGRPQVPGWALAYHGAYEFGGPDAVRGAPRRRQRVDGRRGGVRPRGRTAPRGPLRRHCVELNEADEAAWAAGGHSMLRDATITGTGDEVKRPSRRARRAGCHRGGLPALWLRHPPRAGAVPGGRQGARR